MPDSGGRREQGLSDLSAAASSTMTELPLERFPPDESHDDGALRGTFSLI